MPIDENIVASMSFSIVPLKSLYNLNIYPIIIE